MWSPLVAIILTGWMREVRKRTTEAAAWREHPVHLGVRGPSRPSLQRRYELGITD
ncbi:MAG: hypothetical protein NTY19_49785 [Planctomycetota bacterium]|nr:hypothetical protein [Planctomycetota bacterium]